MALQPQIDLLLDQVLPTVKHFHSKSMLAPHAGTVGRDGSVTSTLLATEGSHHLTVPQAIAHFESSFRKLAEAGEIRACGIFYHSPGVVTSSGKVELPPASTTDECRNIVGLLEHVCGESVYILIPYDRGPDSIEYGMGKLIEKPKNVFLRQQTQSQQAKPGQ